MKLTPLEKFKERGHDLNSVLWAFRVFFRVFSPLKFSHFKRSTKIPPNIVDAFRGREKKDFLRRKVFFGGESKAGTSLKIAENVIGFTDDQELEIFEHVARQKNG